MTLATWLAVVTICVLGAMSPGPSLALVLKQTLTGGRRNGVITALSHGIGVGIYAFLSVLGLAAIITASPTAFNPAVGRRPVSRLAGNERADGKTAAG